MQNNRIAVTSLGGSGEEAPNCSLLRPETIQCCWTARRAPGSAGEFDRVYPALTREIAGRLPRCSCPTPTRTMLPPSLPL